MKNKEEIYKEVRKAIGVENCLNTTILFCRELIMKIEEYQREPNEENAIKVFLQTTSTEIQGEIIREIFKEIVPKNAYEMSKEAKIKILDTISKLR